MVCFAYSMRTIGAPLVSRVGFSRSTCRGTSWRRRVFGRAEKLELGWHSFAARSTAPLSAGTRLLTLNKSADGTERRCVELNLRAAVGEKGRPVVKALAKVERVIVEQRYDCHSHRLGDAANAALHDKRGKKGKSRFYFFSKFNEMAAGRSMSAIDAGRFKAHSSLYLFRHHMRMEPRHKDDAL